MLLPKLYRFALKRLVGPFLVDNELPLEDFEVRLRAKELVLKNLVLDVAALNSFLELDGMEVTHAKVALCQLSFSDTPTLQLSNVLLVIKPGKASAATSKPAALASGSEEEEEDAEGLAPSSVSEGMGFLETWVDKITATLQLRASGVEVRVECESGEVVKLETGSLLSRNLTETRYRQTELHDLTVWVGDTASLVRLAALPHVLVQTPRPGSGELPPVALFVKSIAAELAPKSVLLLQAFYCEFVKATASADDGDEEDGEETKPKKKTLFTVDLERVTLDLVPDLDNPARAVQIGLSGVRVDHQRCSVHRLSCTTWAGADLQLDLLRTDESESDFEFEFERRHATLQADVTITTSLQLSTLSLLAEAFSPPASTTTTTTTSQPASGFLFDATGTCRVVLRGQEDEVIVELHTAKVNESLEVSIESGVVWMNEAEAQVPVFFLERFIRLQVDSATPTPSEVEEEEEDEDDDEEEDGDIGLRASKFEAEALRLPGATVVNLALGGISTPANLEIALYQRFLAVFATAEREDPPPPPSSSALVVRSSCRTGRLMLGQAHEAMEVSFEGLTTFTLGERTVVQARHFALSEFLSNGTQVPLCYASPYASGGHMQQQSGAFLGLITQVSPLHSLLCVQLSNVIFRVEPQSEGFARAAVVFAPAAPAVLPDQPRVVTSTGVECKLVNCVFDVFPSESPFEEKDSRYRPLSRAMLCCGELHVTANLVTQAVSSRFDLTSRDAQLYLAHHSERDVDEYKLEAANGMMPYSNDEYAVKLGFVRVGQWQSTLLFLRFDAETTELEIEMQDGKLMTCPDSFKTLTELLQHLSLAQDPQSPSSSIDLQANSSLSASDLRKHLATAPDSSLSASQLQQRYETTVHLTPFVIEDYYTFASLPHVSAAAVAPVRPANKVLPLDDWVLCDEDDEFKSKSSHKRAQPLSSSAASVRKAPPPSAFTSDVDEDDEDQDEDDKDIMRNSIMFATVTKMGSPASFKPEGRDTIQLIDRADIDSGARRGIEGYKHLHESMMHIVQDIEARDKETLDLVNNESEKYRSALLAGSPPALWQPGQTLQHGSVSSEGAGEEEEEEATMDGKYYEDNMDQVKIINHHFPVPNFPQPGSFSPPAAALAAKRIGEDYNFGPPPSANSQRGEFRFILRNGNMTWCLFGGRDFVEGEEEVAVATATTATTATATITTTMRQSLLVIDDHFSRTTHSTTTTTALFPQSPSSSTTSRRNKSQRDVSNALECVAKGMSLVVDSFADNGGRMSVCFAVHDLEVRDEVKSSPFKQMLHYWDVVNEPRCTGADMLRISVEIGARDGYNIKAASLPLRLKLHQDALDLLQQFNASPAAADTADTAGDFEKPSPPVEFRAFDFRALKMKIDFYPKQVELAKLREGKYTELVCLFNYEGMEVGLKRALFRDVTGAGELVSLVVNLWAEDVYNKQLFNLLAGVSPGLANIATDMANIVLLPVQVLHSHGAAPAASEVVRQSGKLAKTMFVEGIGMSNRMATGALNILDDSRARRVPRSMEEGIAMAGQAMAERAKNAQHTIIAVPLTTLRREGTSGAVKSMIRAIPIAVLQPFLGVGEAFEAIAVGAKHSLKPGDYLQETTKWKRY